MISNSHAEEKQLLAAFYAVARTLTDNGTLAQTPTVTAQGSLRPEILLRMAARQARLIVRRVRLRRSRWRGDVTGPLLGFLRDTGKPVALLPVQKSSYVLYDPETGRREPLSETRAADLDEHAFTFTRCLPDRVTSSAGFFEFGLGLVRREGISTLIAGSGNGLLQLSLPIAAIAVVERVRFGDSGFPFTIAVGLLLVMIGAATLYGAGALSGLRMNGQLALYLEPALWERLLRLPVSFFRSRPATEISARINSTRELSHVFTEERPEVLRHSVAAFANLALMAWLNPVLAAAAAIFSTLIVSARIILQKRQKVLTNELFQTEVRNREFLLGMLTDLPQLRLAAADRRPIGVWDRSFVAECSMTARLRRSRIAEIVLEVGVLPAGWFFILVLDYIGGQHTKFSSAGSLLGFSIAFGQCLAAVRFTTEYWLERYRRTAGDDRLGPILKTTTEGVNRFSGQTEIGGALDIEGLHFRYPESATWALSDVSIRIQPGQFVGLAGPSGSGKSTLLRLLLGFEQPSAGRILFDGKQLAELDLMKLRSQIDAVLQDETLTPGTIRSNIVGMSPLGEKEAWAAACLAQFDQEIAAMPMGMQTFAKDDVLSASQKQRLLIARAIVLRPRILFLDEATSSLDEDTQARILSSLRECNKTGPGLTCLMVSHRPSLLAQMDVVHVFDHGRVVETRFPKRPSVTPASAPAASNSMSSRLTGSTPFSREALDRLALPQPVDDLARLTRPGLARILLLVGFLTAAAGIGIWLIAA